MKTVARLSLTVALLVVVGVHQSAAFLRSWYPDTEPANYYLKSNSILQGSATGNDSKPLLVTPLIEAGKLEEARRLSEVKGLPGPAIKSYSGFFTVNKTHNSNMFYWFFPAMSGKTDVPVLVWLQGGPGASSLFGLFVENGPIQVEKDGTVTARNFTWNREFAMLYVDSPVGTGFSFTDHDEGYARNQEDVARDLYEAMRQFFALYTEYHGKPFYVTGESYAGKYVPALAYKIHQMGAKAKEAGINLKGLAIGDGMCDPRTMLNYGDYLYQIGLLDEPQRDHFAEVEKKTASLIDQKRFKEAFEQFDQLLDGDLIKGKSYFENATGMSFYFNFLYDHEPPAHSYHLKFLALPATRESLHVGNIPYKTGSTVEKHLLNDIMDTVKPWIEKLLDAKYPILLYSGQLDIIVAAPLTENFLQTVQWKGAKTYKSAPRTIYRLASDEKSVAGYVRRADNLVQVIIRNAGHILPYDQQIGRAHV